MLPAREVAPPSELQAAEAESVKAAAWVQPAASALRALSLQAEAAGVACVQAAQPRAAAGSGARVQPPEVAVAASDVAAEPQQEAVAAEPDAVLQPGEAAAEAARAVEALRPVVVAEAERDAEVQRLAAGGAAGALGAAAGGGAPGVGLLGLPSGPTSSLAWATTSGADCACDVEVASCATVKAVVASSTMRRFVMMSLVPGKGLAATDIAFIDG